MTVSDYEKGRKELWKYIFRQRVDLIIRNSKERRHKWHNLVDSVLHKQRFQTLINSLKRTPFTQLLINSRLCSEAKKKALLKRSCSECGSTDTVIDVGVGPCQCHLCEDWFGCGSGRNCADQLVCRQYRYRQNLGCLLILKVVKTPTLRPIFLLDLFVCLLFNDTSTLMGH